MTLLLFLLTFEEETMDPAELAELVAKAEKFKEQGNTHFTQKDYVEAVYYYTNGLDMCAFDLWVSHQSDCPKRILWRQFSTATGPHVSLPKKIGKKPLKTQQKH